MSFIADGLPMATLVESELFFPPPLVGRFDLDDVTVTVGGDAAEEPVFAFFYKKLK